MSSRHCPPRRQSGLLKCVLTNVLLSFMSLLPWQAIVNPIIDRMQAAVPASHTNAVEAQPLLIQTINSLTACLKGLSPSDDEIFDAVDDEDQKEEEMKRVRSDERMARLREKIYMAIEGVVGVWNGDSETADVGRKPDADLLFCC